MDWAGFIKLALLHAYVSSVCADSFDNCVDHKCLNSATCIDGVNTYTCKCPKGFTGDYCEKDIDECVLYKPCQNNAPCRNNFGSYYCECFLGWTGQNCSINVDDCSSSPCQNGGKCIDKTNSQFDCECMPGFVGPRCEYKDPCKSNPCHPTGSRKCTADNLGRYHCDCNRGYYGKACSLDIDECSEGDISPCAFGKCINLPGEYRCECDKGYEGPHCEKDIQECEPNPCKNKGICLDKIGKYVCSCQGGFTGTNCTLDIDECKTKFPCQNGGRCSNSYGSYQCDCPPDFVGRNCETRRRHCENQPCLNGGRCYEYNSYFHCVCPSGFRGPHCEIDVDDCANVQCQNNGVCIDGVNTWHCKCPSGYRGKYCEEKVNVCSLNPCRNGGKCVSHDDGYSCSCLPGTSGKHCELSVASCLHEAGKCLNGGKCITSGHRQFCSCRNNYSGPLCEFSQFRNVGSCATNPCQNSGNCTQIDSALYTCRCPHEFSGAHCEKRHEPCELNYCQHEARCETIGDSFRCHCPPGYKGVHCEINIDECASDPCGPHGSCIDLINDYRCNCHQSWTGPNCDIKQDLCQPNPCSNGAICSLQADGKSYQCDCSTAFGLFTGDQCTEDVDECSLHENVCKNGGVCINTSGSFVCRCPYGYTGQHCQENINDCVSHPCLNGGHCEDGVAAYTCSCLPGFFGTRCELEKDECMSQPCKNNATCVDHINSYTCTCRPGFSGINCEINDNDCSPSSCINGGICHDLVNGFRCDCKPGYTGDHCEIKTTVCDKRPCKNNGMCVLMDSPESDNQAFICKCLPGYAGALCDHFADLCLQSSCGNQGICQQTGANVTCKCQNGYSGQRCRIPPNQTCSSYKEVLSRDSSRQSVCLNGGHCYDINQSVRCSCPSGFTGDFCEINIDDCVSHPCKNGALCVDKVGIYQCKCLPGYQGKNCEHLFDNCKSSPCLNNGKCINLVNDYHCVCPPGITGKNCQSNEDECKYNKCENGATCEDQVGGYNCICPSGYTGRYCEADINECQNPLSVTHSHHNLGPCYPQGSHDCHQINDQFKCVCKPGYTGKFCNVSIDLCAEAKKNGLICSNGGKCVVDPRNGGNATCVCPSGYSGPTCRQHDIACLSLPCQNGGVCRPLFQPHPPYKCECPPGLGGLLCEVDIVDECTETVCENGALCFDRPGKAECRCRAGFCGERCERSCPTQPPTLSVCNKDNHCSLSKPWSNCSAQKQHGVLCSKLSYNGVCDPVCNTESCLFDGWDCLSQSKISCPQEENCAKVYDDGECNLECSSKACQYDGGDCLASGEHKAAGWLILVLDTSPTEFMETWMLPLTRSLSTLLKTTVRLLFDQNQPRVQWYKNNRNSKLTRVSFEIDNTVCQKSGSPCFEQASSAAEFISAALTERQYSPPVPIVKVESSNYRNVKPVTTIHIYVISAIVCSVVIFVLIGVLVGAKRPYNNTVKAKTWFPYGMSRPSHSPDTNSSIATNSRTLCVSDPIYMQLMPSSNKNTLSTNQRSDARMTSSVELQSWESGQALIERTGCDSVASTESHCSLGSHNAEAEPGQRGEDGVPPAKRSKKSQPKISDESALLSGMMQCLLSGNGLEDFPNSDHILSSFLSRVSAIKRQSSMETLLSSSVNTYCETLLHIAAKNNRCQAAKQLIDAGSNLNVTDIIGRTPLLSAISADALETARLLLSDRRIDPYCRSNDGATPLIHAVKSTDLHMVHLVLEGNIPEETYLNSADNEGRTALHWAAVTNQIRMLQILLSRGCNRDAQTKQEETPLLLAAKENALNCCKYLISSGASLDVCDQLGRTPKSLATELGYRDLLALFESYELHSFGQIAPNVTYHNLSGQSAMRCRQPPCWTQTSPLAAAGMTPHQQATSYWQHQPNNVPPSAWSVTSSLPMKTPSIDSDSPGRWDSSPGSPGTFQLPLHQNQQVAAACHSLHNPIYSATLGDRYYPYQSHVVQGGMGTSPSDQQQMQRFAYPTADRLILEPKLV